MVKLTREKQSGGAWETVVEDAGGGSQPIFLPMTFTETVDGATYTASIDLPANTRLLDVLVETFTAWTAATAPLDVGDSDAADALASGLNVAAQMGVVGANATGTDWGNGLTGADGPYGYNGTQASTSGPGKLYPAGDTITAVITPTVPGGPTGVSRVTLIAQVEAAAVAAVVT